MFVGDMEGFIWGGEMIGWLGRECMREVGWWVGSDGGRGGM